METISDKLVNIRKPRRCNGCWRVFKIGTPMRCQVNNYDGIGSFYTCETCTKLIGLGYGVDDFENVYHDGFVIEGLEKGQTPEQLLETLTQPKQNGN